MNKIDFWSLWTVLTTISIGIAFLVGSMTHQWFFGVITYFVIGIVKDAYLLTKYSKTFDENSDLL